MVGGSRLLPSPTRSCHGMPATPLTMMAGRYRADSGGRISIVELSAEGVLVPA